MKTHLATILLVFIVCSVVSKQPYISNLSIKVYPRSSVSIGSNIRIECHLKSDRDKYFTSYRRPHISWTPSSHRYKTTGKEEATNIGGQFRDVWWYLDVKSVTCQDDTTFTCSVEVVKLYSANDKEYKKASLKIKVTEPSERPSTMTFEPKKLVGNSEVTFICKGKVDKHAGQDLEMYLQKRGGIGARINLPIDATNRRNRPDPRRAYSCVTIQTVTSRFGLDKAHYDYTVTCQIKNKQAYSKSVYLDFTDPETSTITAPRISQLGFQSDATKPPGQPTKSTSTPVILGVIGGVILAVLLIFLTVLYVWHKRKPLEVYLEDPQMVMSQGGSSRIIIGPTGSIVRTMSITGGSPASRSYLTHTIQPPACRPSQMMSVHPDDVYDDDVSSGRNCRTSRSSRYSRSSRRRDESPDYSLDSEVQQRRASRSRRRR